MKSSYFVFLADRYEEINKRGEKSNLLRGWYYE